MENLDTSAYIPVQTEGVENNSIAEKTLDTEMAAKEFFSAAAKRLMDVNAWGTYTGPLTASFQLCDSKGDEVQRTVKLHDHFKINIPGPGNTAGEGYDWVRVEELKRFQAPDEDMLLIRVRPAANPLNNKTDVAHFLSDSATSSFVVKRKGTMVAAEVHGRNEKPNVEAESVLDKARNALAGTAAVALVSKYQWKSLVNGLLDFEIKSS